jgi:hypothetical protein
MKVTVGLWEVAGSVLMILGCAAVAWCGYVGYAAYALAGLFGLRDIRNLNIATVGEVAIIFALGAALFGLGLRLMLRRRARPAADHE